MTGAELAFTSGAELGRRFATRELSPVEVTEALLERITALDPRLNAFLLVTAERARADARTAEAELARGASRGPLHGVPLALKDLFDTAGIRTTAGSRVLADHVPARDAAVVERLRNAGTVLLGKTHLHEFAFGTTTTNDHYGPCRNPWDVERVPGGSSGGSGAGLAAGLFPLSLGTDTGGSIRIPASVCGVVGLKPTFGRVSRRGVTPLSWSLDHVGPMTRTVEDAALLLDAIAGVDPEDPWCADVPAGGFGRDLDRGVEGMRVGVSPRWFHAGAEPDVAAAVERAIAQLERLGARRVEVDPPHLDQAYTALHAILASEAAAFHAPWLRERADDYGEEVRRSLELGFMIPAVDYVNARRLQAMVSEGFAAALREVDALVVPTLPRTAPKIGDPPSREPLLAWNRLVAAFNLSGLPAISVPCGIDREGLPIGLQIAGRAFDEATVLRVAAAYERETDWHTRRPPGFG